MFYFFCFHYIFATPNAIKSYLLAFNNWLITHTLPGELFTSLQDSSYQEYPVLAITIVIYS